MKKRDAQKRALRAVEASTRDLQLPGVVQKPEKAKIIPSRRFTVHLPTELVERLRNAAYYSKEITLSGLAEGALRKAVRKLEKKRGGKFPQRKNELKGGRPRNQ